MADEHESRAAYRERKRDEVALLREAAGAPETDWPRDVPELIVEKQRLRARILARAVLEDPGLTESNLGGRARHYRDGRIDFSYHRWDARWAIGRFAEWIYPAAASTWPRVLSLGVLTGSGMAAIAATLTVLDRVLPAATPLLLHRQLYFETFDFIGRSVRRLQPTERTPDAPWAGSVLYLDSIAPADEAAAITRSLAGLAAVVIDTTCYDAASPRLAALVARASADGVPLLLVRSHLKLDCLGIEYGRLGSIVVVLPRPASAAQIAFARAFRRAVLKEVALYGSTFSPYNVFPPAHEPGLRARFWALNARRNQRMAVANARVAAAVGARAAAASATRVHGYHHGCFVVVTPLLAGVETTRAFVEDLRARLVRAGLHAMRAPSFGYDFIAINDRFADENGVRISVPDLASDDLERLVEVAGEWAVRLDPWSQPG